MVILRYRKHAYEAVTLNAVGTADPRRRIVYVKHTQVAGTCLRTRGSLSHKDTLPALSAQVSSSPEKVYERGGV